MTNNYNIRPTLKITKHETPPVILQSGD